MGWENSTRRSRLPAGWSHRIVPRILERDNRICHVCGEAGADQVDHVIAGDDHSDSNLAAIHDNPCHRRKTAAEAAAARAAKPQRNRPPERHPGWL